jgi:hypothetical protein
MRNAAGIFSAVVISGFLILSAWGNATAMLIFSIIAMAAGLAIPSFRGETSIRRRQE